LKCIILGSAGAGKTSLLRRYVHGSFEDHHLTSIASQQVVTTITVVESHCQVQLWDTRGKEQLAPPEWYALFRNIDACMLVYDATSSMSFLQLMQWHEEWMKRLRYWEMEDSVPFIVVANKIDLLYGENNGAESQLPANRSMILLWCQRNGIPHVEASALDGRGVDEAMQQLVKMGVEELGKREMAVVMKKEYEDM
ncbi:ras superfamily gtp-binding protein, partial [Thalassiosira pseudonana CCMP1335]